MIKSNLQIYRASAGSGKTFTLVRNYLEIVLRSNTSKLDTYKNVLAVTFTNKATEEMKTRIIEELRRIAKNEDSQHIEHLCTVLNVNKLELTKSANEVISNILHDYSNFSISTIDSFFQRIVKSFAKELKINPKSESILNFKEIQEVVISRVFDKAIVDDKLLSVLIDFSNSKLNSKGKWNIKNDLISFLNEITKESFILNKPLILEQINKIDLKAFTNELFAIVKDFERRERELGEKGLSIISRNSLEVQDFPNKASSFANTFYKALENKQSKEGALGKRFLQAVDNVDVWTIKTTSKDKINNIINSFSDGLNDLMEELIILFEDDFAVYLSAKAVLDNVYQTFLINYFIKTLDEYCKEENKQMLSFVNSVVSDVVKDSNAPFIYEKVGATYTNYMIDEFQDTSTLQWTNFKPLLEESNSKGFTNYIVGDIKQAIYRFRNGNWNLMHQLCNENKVTNLEYNYRSLDNIVKFNNVFYEYAAKYIFDQSSTLHIEDSVKQYVTDIYKDHSQKIKDKETLDDKGFIRINSFEKIDDAVLSENMIVDIKSLFDAGFKESDIAILLRNGTDEPKFSQILLKNNIRFVSEKSLMLNNAWVCRVVISILRLLADYKDMIARKELETLLYFKKNYQNIDELLQTCYTNKNIYETTERIVKGLNLNEYADEYCFLVALIDVIYDFTKSKSSSILEFIEFWNENNENFLVTLNNDIEGIRLLTIHKSKGLEFEVVMMPYCNWNNTNPNNDDIIWVSSDRKPFDSLAQIAIKPKKELEKSIFAIDYALYNINTYIDNLNLLYVATTRARQGLIAYTEQPIDAKKERAFNVTNIVNEFTINAFNTILKQKDLSIKLFELGEIQKISKNKEVAKSDKLIIDAIYSSEKVFNIRRIKNLGFKDNAINKNIAYGLVYHDMFKNIVTTQDIERVVKDFTNKGYIQNPKLVIDEIKQKIGNLGLSMYFDSKSKIKTECNILMPKQYEKRPDRVVFFEDKVVVIDYKFGLEENDHYKSQVKSYISLINDMGYQNVQGLIWYYQLDKVVNI